MYPVVWNGKVLVRFRTIFCDEGDLRDGMYELGGWRWEKR